MAQHHPGSSVHGPHNPADMYVHVAVLAQLTHLVVILPQAHDGEPTGIVRGLGCAYVEEAGSVRKLHHVIDMRADANVFV